jgi:hypothetical protein
LPPHKAVQGVELLVFGKRSLDIDIPRIPQDHGKGGMPQEQPLILSATHFIFLCLWFEKDYMAYLE